MRKQMQLVHAVGEVYKKMTVCQRIVPWYIQAAVDVLSSEWQRNVSGLVLICMLKFESILLLCSIDVLNFLRNTAQQEAVQPELFISGILLNV